MKIIGTKEEIEQLEDATRYTYLNCGLECECMECLLDVPGKCGILNNPKIEIEYTPEVKDNYDFAPGKRG